MALSKKPYKGTRDLFPKEKREQDYIFSKMSKAAVTFGYEPYDGPMLEEVELYKAKSGEELINDQIYSFTDRGDRFVAIRPEMTPTLARMVANIHREYPKPIRWYSIPNLMRYERPQKGRLREHWQLNCDIFGAPDRLGESEILSVAVHLFKSFGANSKHFEILVNDREIVDTVFNSLMGLSNEITYKLYKIVDRSKKVDHEAVTKMVDELPLDKEQKTLFYQYLGLKNFDEVITFLQNKAQEEQAKKFSNFVEQIKNFGLMEYVTYDPTIVRGLDYYTGVVFEIFDKHPDNPRALCGGGAYANLLQIFNEPALPGVGFGLGDVTLTSFLKNHKLMPNFEAPENDLLLTFQEESCKEHALKLAAALRDKSIRVLSGLETIKFKKVFPLATKKGAHFVGFIGDKELADKTVQIKDMETKEQHVINIDDIEQLTTLLKKM